MENLGIKKMGEFVFFNPDSTKKFKDLFWYFPPIQPHALTKAWAAMTKKLGFKGRVYDIRHTWATTAIRLTNEYAQVSKMLGHSNISTTIDLYGHLVSEDLRDVANKVEQTFSDPETEEMKKFVESTGAILIDPEIEKVQKIVDDWDKFKKVWKRQQILILHKNNESKTIFGLIADKNIGSEVDKIYRNLLKKY